MTIYLDSSALVKLLVEEAETASLRDYLDTHPHSALVSSALILVEVNRAARLVSAELAADAAELCSEVDVIPISPDLLVEAGVLEPRTLRSLDAIHLASALRMARHGRTAFVAYDVRLLEAAEAAGLATASPGR